MGELVVEHGSDGVAVATLDRPDQRNAITMGLQQELDEALTTLEDDGETRCLVVTGAGERAFSAGYDLHEMAAWSEDELTVRLLERERWVWHFASTPLPVIVALRGITYGAGAILASAADIRCAAPDAELKFTAAAYGGANATWTVPLLVGHGMASELLLTARVVRADEALRIGLVNRVDEDPLGAALDLARSIAANPAPGVRGVKQLLRSHVGRAFQERFEAEGLAMRTDLRPRPIQETYQQGNGTFKPRAA